MSNEMRDRLLRRAQRSQGEVAEAGTDDAVASVTDCPIGLHIKDEWVRRRERAVRRLLQRGILQTDRLVEAFLEVAPERYMDEGEARAYLSNRSDSPDAEGKAPAWLGIDACAIGLEALNPGLGDRVADGLALRGYLAALFSKLVGDDGEVVVLFPGSRWASRKLRKALKPLDNISVALGRATTVRGLDGRFDAIWIGAALPRAPLRFRSHLRQPTGRLVTLLGPRIRPQDLVCLTHRDGELHERRMARIRVPIVAGPNGWLDEPKEAR